MNIFRKLFASLNNKDRGSLALPPLKPTLIDPRSASNILPYSVDELLATQQSIINRIRSDIRLGEDHFVQYYLPVIRRYASYVHLLPASQAHHHRGIGGLLVHGLEVGQYALHLYINCKIELELTKEGQARYNAKPRWDLASFIVGVAHDLGKIITDMEVLHEGKNLVWNPFEYPLNDWLQINKLESYQVKFIPSRHKKHDEIGTLLIDKLITPELRAYLLAGDRDVIEMIFSAIAGKSKKNVFLACAIEADKVSVQKYMQSAKPVSSPAINSGMAVHEHLTLAINRLFSERYWNVNLPGEVAWVIDNQLFLTWPRAAKDMLTLLARDSIPTIPHDLEVVAKILSDSGIIVEHTQGNPYWGIFPEGVKPLKVVRLAKANQWINPLPANTTGRIYNTDSKLRRPSTEKNDSILLRSENNPVVQHFLQTLASTAPPFPIQVVGQHFYTHMTEAEKWFNRNGISRSQMLIFVREKQLGLIHKPNGKGKMIGPPS